MPVIPTADGVRTRSAFFGLPSVFTWVVALLLCPTNCVVHFFLLGGCRGRASNNTSGFVAPDVVGYVLTVELAAVDAPCWLVASAVPVVVVVVIIVSTAPTAPVATFFVVLVLLGGLLLLLLPRLRRVHCQFLLHLLHHHRLLLYLILLVANCLLRA